MAESHYIPRSHGGLGVEQNILTLCRQCHIRMDSTSERHDLLRQAKEYLMSKYPYWDESKLVYKI